MNPSIDVIMPVYKNKDSLPISVASLLEQDYEGSIRLLLMFDDAHDGTKEVIEELQKKYGEKILVVTTPTPMGLGGARKEAIPYLKADYVYSLDADDTMLPGAMKRLVQTAIEKDADCVNAAFLESKGPKSKLTPFRKEATYNKYGAISALFFDASFRSFLWAKLFRRELYETSPLAIPQGKGVMFEDLPLCLSLLLACKKVVSVTYPVVDYRLDVATSSSTEMRSDRSLRHLVSFALCRKILERTEDPRALRIFFHYRYRFALSFAYDLGRDKKGHCKKAYKKEMKAAFRQLFSRRPLEDKDAPYTPYLEGAFIR